MKINNLILKSIWKHKRPRIAKTILKKKNKVRELKLPDFKPYQKAVIIKTLLNWPKYSHIDRPNADPYVYVELIFDESAKVDP